MRSSDRRLSPVLADEPLVGEGLKRRFRVVLISVTLAFALTNVASYLIGQAVRSEAEQDTRERIASLERRFAADLEERGRVRDAEAARQDAELRQLRTDACTLADRTQPRDAELQDLRRRYGCNGNVAPSASSTDRPPTPAPGPVRPSSDGGSRSAPASPTPRPEPPSPAAPTSAAPKPPAPPSSPAPPPEPGDGLICLPLLGCVL